jgi:hypothetical protein
MGILKWVALGDSGFLLEAIMIRRIIKGTCILRESE